MKLVKIKKSRQVLLVSLVLAIVGVGFYWMLFSNVRSAAQSYTELLNEIVFETERGERLDSIHRLFREIGDEIEGINNYFLVEDEVLGFVEAIESLASGQSVDLDIGRLDITAGEKIEDSVLSLSASISGDWKNIVSFLALIETAPFAIEIKKVSIAALGPEQDGTTEEDDEAEGQRVASGIRKWGGVVEAIVLMSDSENK